MKFTFLQKRQDILSHPPPTTDWADQLPPSCSVVADSLFAQFRPHNFFTPLRFATLCCWVSLHNFCQLFHPCPCKCRVWRLSLVKKNDPVVFHTLCFHPLLPWKSLTSRSQYFSFNSLIRYTLVLISRSASGSVSSKFGLWFGVSEIWSHLQSRIQSIRKSFI